MVKTNVESTQLDFEAIRSKLKTYFAASDQFKDYNFEGSALANILDVLAYNTHFNALMANMAINESYLETAQLRSSILTHAYSLGYFPSSVLAASATLEVRTSLAGVEGRPSTITLPAGTRFTTSIEGVTYTFQTLQTYAATDDGNGEYVFLDQNGLANIKVFEGNTVTRTFFVGAKGDKNLYVIADPNMDTTTVDVRVFANASTTLYDSYSNISKAIRVNADSKYFLLKESPNGNYELQFGDGVATGKAPTAGNKVTVTYLSSAGETANGASLFTALDPVVVDGTPYSLVTTLVYRSSGGAPKEANESIRLHAPLVYSTQRRMVTSYDYHSLIQSNYPDLQDVIAWGGQDNDPIDYGKVFISIRYPDEYDSDTKQGIQDDISNNLIAPLGTLSITPEYIEPIQTYLALTVNFDFNPVLSGVTIQTAEDQIFAICQKYFDDNLGQFGKQFRRSNLLALIDGLSDAVLSSRIDIVMNQRFIPDLVNSRSYTISFPETILGPDDVNYRIDSTKFIYDGEACIIRNKLNTNTLEIVNAAGTVLVNNIGDYTTGTGKVNLINFAPEGILGGVNYIKIRAIPSNQGTLSPLRNYTLEFDTEDTLVRGTVDYQSTRVSL